jgi:hypothetical protein
MQLQRVSARPPALTAARTGRSTMPEGGPMRPLDPLRRWRVVVQWDCVRLRTRTWRPSSEAGDCGWVTLPHLCPYMRLRDQCRDRSPGHKEQPR